MIYHCCDELRRDSVAAHRLLNGIDYLEVLDRDLSDKDPLRQRTLLLRLLKPVAGLADKNLKIIGGERVRNIQIEWAEVATPIPPQMSGAAEADSATLVSHIPNPQNVLVIRTDAIGDYSTYRLQLVRSPSDPCPPKNFDPRLSEVEFSFKVECPSDFDCKPVGVCPEEPRAIPDIDYLVKDYASFRRLILDRLTHLVPDWRERSAADFGVALAELLAYVGDHLSYWQDAVATEAYLETARRRASLRRHALLVDYHMHDGCNARAWLQVQVAVDGIVLPRQGTRFYTRVPGLPPRIAPGSPEDAEALRQAPIVFEPMHGATLFTAHNKIQIYTWGDRNCCLPKGATQATLLGHLPKLENDPKGFDLLLFEEVIGPATGNPGDADRSRRHVVRLTDVQSSSTDDPAQPLTDPLTGVQITEVAWAKDDALPFPLCVSATVEREDGPELIERVSVARGNLVLCDHGLTLAQDEVLGKVPSVSTVYARAASSPHCAPQPVETVPPRFYPKLANGPLTFVGKVEKVTRPQGGVEKREPVSFDPEAPASAAMRWKVHDAIPELHLRSIENQQPQDWKKPVRDLLNSKAGDRQCVVEVEYDGSSMLRFGDDRFGKRPEAGTPFKARYRVGTESPGMWARKPLRMSSQRMGGSWACAIRSRREAASRPRPPPKSGGARRRPSVPRSVRSRPPTMPRSQSVSRASSALLRPCAGREAGTPSSSRSIARAPSHSIRTSRLAWRGTSSGTVWRGKTSNSITPYTFLWKSIYWFASRRITSVTMYVRDCSTY